MRIPDREFMPNGFFGKRGISREVAEERPYTRFEHGDADTVFAAEPRLAEYGGFVHWLVCRTALSHTCGVDGRDGYVMTKHAVFDDLDDPVAQVRPDTGQEPVTSITYHDHTGVAHTRGKGCACGAGHHRRAYVQPTYNAEERRAHEEGHAHTEPDPSDPDGAPLPVDGPHRHTTIGKYMLNPNREWRGVSHTHRVLNDVERHVNRAVDHRQGGHGGAWDGGLDDVHPHYREVDYALEFVEVPHKPHRSYKQHSVVKSGHRAGDDGRIAFDQYCRKCVTERHVREEHVTIRWSAPHTHIRTQRGSLSSTEKRLDANPRSLARLRAGERPARVFFSIEGTPKCDALVSAGEVAFDVPSVTMWRADELERFAAEYLTKSAVFIVPDSDWGTNPLVALQAFECREFLRRVLEADDRVHVAAAPAKCGDVCTCGASGKPVRDHKWGVDDFLGAGHTPDELNVLDRHPGDLFFGWASAHVALAPNKGNGKNGARTDVAVMEWLALHATADGLVKRSVTSIAEYVGKTDQAVYDSFDRLVAVGILETVPPGIDLTRITKYRRKGARTIYLGEDYEGGITFRIDGAARWRDERQTVAELLDELERLSAITLPRLPAP